MGDILEKPFKNISILFGLGALIGVSVSIPAIRQARLDDSNISESANGHSCDPICAKRPFHRKGMSGLSQMQNGSCDPN